MTASLVNTISEVSQNFFHKEVYAREIARRVAPSIHAYFIVKIANLGVLYFPGFATDSCETSHIY